MAIKWEDDGADMRIIDLRTLDSDTFVVHFGSNGTTVDAYTFSNSLVSLADSLIEINSIISPGQKIDIRLDAVAPGSYRTTIQVKKKLASLFKSAALFLAGVLATHYIENALDGESRTEVFPDRVEITKGNDKIIVSKEVFEGYEATKNDEKLNRNVQKTFKCLNSDDSVTNFGITKSIHDELPIAQISKRDFPKIIENTSDLISDERRKKNTKTARLVILKPWVNGENRKWSFEWNEVPISAYMDDENFIQRIKDHSLTFGNSDIIEVDIEFYTDHDDVRDIWINDSSTYRIKHVNSFIRWSGERIDF